MPPVTVPFVGSITAPSVGTGLNVNVPPNVPVTVAVPPSQVGVIVKPASSEAKTTKLNSGVALTLLQLASPTLSIRT